MHPNYSDLRAIAACIANATGATLGYLPEGGNTAGAWLAGCVPHRGAGGVETEQTGLSAAEMLDAMPKALMLVGVEPRYEQSDAERARNAEGNQSHHHVYASQSSRSCTRQYCIAIGSVCRDCRYVC